MKTKQIKMHVPTLRELIARSYDLFEDWHLRRQWVKQSFYLYQSKKHIVLTGKYPRQ